MSDAIVIEVRRGGTVESRHLVHAVAVREGEVLASAGDPQLVTFLRSSAKPLQALSLARTREDMPADELAIACASHLARPEQVAPVKRMLDRVGATEHDLECGAVGDPPSRLNHNCSGKHAGMVTVCRDRGWPQQGYRLPQHQLQQRILDELAAVSGLPASRIATATDGCGVVTYALPLDRMARAFARIPALEGGGAVTAAMRAYPELIRGPGAADTVLMQTLDGWIAKGGAEGLMCAAGPDGTGVALKVADGSGRAVRPALAAFLERIGLELPQLAVLSVENSLGAEVGEIRSAP